MNEEQINNNSIEHDIQRVGQEVREQIGSTATVEATERALVRQSLTPIVRPAPGVSTASTDRSSTDDAQLPTYMKDMSVEIKDRVERLVEDAFKHGVEHAAIEAQKYGPFVVDALHDALSDRFYSELKKRNLV